MPRKNFIYGGIIATILFALFFASQNIYSRASHLDYNLQKQDVQGEVRGFQTARAMVSNNSPETAWDTEMASSTPFVLFGSTSAIFTWTTSKLTLGQIYYDTAPLGLGADEKTKFRQQPHVKITYAPDSGGWQIIHALTILNLQPNTLYYCLIRSIDSAGNINMEWPIIFRTRTITNNNPPPEQNLFDI